jgi:hypothetical protein
VDQAGQADPCVLARTEPAATTRRAGHPVQGVPISTCAAPRRSRGQEATSPLTLKGAPALAVRRILDITPVHGDPDAGRCVHCCRIGRRHPQFTPKNRGRSSVRARTGAHAWGAATVVHTFEAVMHGSAESPVAQRWSVAVATAAAAARHGVGLRDLNFEVRLHQVNAHANHWA